MARQFHFEMNVMNAIYQRYRGSELEELLVMADTVALTLLIRLRKGNFIGEVSSV